MKYLGCAYCTGLAFCVFSSAIRRLNSRNNFLRKDWYCSKLSRPFLTWLPQRSPPQRIKRKAIGYWTENVSVTTNHYCCSFSFLLFRFRCKAARHTRAFVLKDRGSNLAKPMKWTYHLFAEVWTSLTQQIVVVSLFKDVTDTKRNG